jgi:hypothetical protein
VNQAAVGHVARHCPTQFEDLLLRVELKKLVEQRLVNIVVVNEYSLGVVKR